MVRIRTILRGFTRTRGGTRRRVEPRLGRRDGGGVRGWWVRQEGGWEVGRGGGGGEFTVQSLSSSLFPLTQRKYYAATRSH